MKIGNKSFLHNLMLVLGKEGGKYGPNHQNYLYVCSQLNKSHSQIYTYSQ